MGTTVSKTQPSTEKNEKGSSLAVSGETAAMILQRLSLKDADAVCPDPFSPVHATHLVCNRVKPFQSLSQYHSESSYLSYHEV